jgi:hypothetical protein
MANRRDSDERNRLVAEARELIAHSGVLAMLTRKQLAAMLNRKVGTLNDWAWRKVGPRSIVVGGRPMYRWGDVEAYLNAQTTGTTDQPAEGSVVA